MVKEFIRFSCENCGFQVKIESRFGGRRGKCPRCRLLCSVPMESVDISPSSITPPATDIRPDTTDPLTRMLEQMAPLRTTDFQSTLRVAHESNCHGAAGFFRAMLFIQDAVRMKDAVSIAQRLLLAFDAMKRASTWPDFTGDMRECFEGMELMMDQVLLAVVIRTNNRYAEDHLAAKTDRGRRGVVRRAMATFDRLETMRDRARQWPSWQAAVAEARTKWTLQQ